jgi:membrane-associated phospholipid phosphatase
MELARAAFRPLRVDLAILVAFAGVVALLLLGRHRPLPLTHLRVSSTACAFAILVAVAFAARLPRLLARDRRALARAVAMVRDFAPLILILFVYDNTAGLTRIIRPDLADPLLRAADRALLGVDPALWLQRLCRPWLTEFMSFVYALLFGFPALILLRLHLRGETAAFREFGLALSLCFYFGLLGYMLVPAVGPRYTMAAELSVPLRGYWFTEHAARAWRSIEQIDRDCFPSLHTAISTIALAQLLRQRRRWPGGRALLGVCAPLIVLLWCSTVYLRYHYVVDVLAGFVVALVCVRLSAALCKLALPCSDVGFTS